MVIVTDDSAKRIAEEGRRDPVIGVVQKTFVHDSPSDFSNHEVNVKAVNENEEFKKLPVHVSVAGEAYVPQKGDAVEVQFLGSDTQSGYVANCIYTAQNRAPLAREGHWRKRFGPDGGPYLFVEAEPSDHSAGDPDTIRFAKKPDGLSDPTTEIEIDDSGSTTQINITTDGDINIDADGNVYLGDSSGTFKEVARKGDPVEVFDPDSGTNTGNITDGSSNVKSS